MISEIVVACMAVFMVIGAADKALFNNPEFPVEC